MGKGAAEDSPVVPLDRAFEVGYRAAYEELAGKGERVLACCMLQLDGAEYPVDFEFDDGNIPQEGTMFFSFILELRRRPPPLFLPRSLFVSGSVLLPQLSS